MRLRSHSLQLLLLLLYISCPSSNAYVVSGESWPNSGALMSVHISGNSSSGVTWDQAFSEAAALWTDSSSFIFNIQRVQSHPCAGYLPLQFPEDGLNGTAFHTDACGDPFGSGVLAITLTRYSGDSLIEADIVFKQDKPWDVYNGPSGFRFDNDFRRVAAHELGHALGLSHEEVQVSLMAPLIADIEAPTQDDLSGVALLYGDPTAQILLNLEEPVADKPVSGVSNIRGWALATHGVERVELYIDARLVATLPYGGSRQDVADSFPLFPSSDSSGFSMTLAWGLLSPGAHTVTIRVYDILGDFAEQSNAITVASFANPFIQDSRQIQIGGSLEVLDANSFRLPGVSADGQTYDITLQWRTESQKFEIITITPR